MGVSITIIDGQTSTDINVLEATSVLTGLSNGEAAVIEVTNSASTLIEVLAGVQGAPGVQNVFSGPTPPDNPQEGWIWIQTNV